MTQKKTKKLFISFLSLVFAAAFLSIGAVAVAPALDLTKAGVIVVNLQTPDVKRDPVPDYGFELFHVANAVNDGGSLKFASTADFADVGVDFNALDTASASKEAASLLANHAKEKGYEGLKGSTDASGRLTYGNVKMGVHLLIPQNPPGVEGYYPVDPILVALPFLNAQGNAWKYAVNVYPKLEEEESTTAPVEETTIPDESTTLPTDQSGQGTGKNPDLPQTGLLRWPVPVLSSAGVILFGLGWADVNLKKRKKDDE